MEIKAIILVPLLAVWMLLAGPVQANTPWANFDRALFAGTCKYFENRARFQDRGDPQNLEARLADGCAQALRDMISPAQGSPYVAKRARLYLDRLTAFKSVVVGMNTKGFLARSTRASRASFDLGSVMVSPTGEYLIARHMGVLDLFANWAQASRVGRSFR